MGMNTTTIKTSSDGAWQGDNPLDFAFPLLIIQTTVILLTSRLLAFLLKPLRQPRVIAEILGGILLGPSALGRNKDFLRLVFPPWSTPILESVASIGLLFFLFLVGLELDLSSIRRSGKRAFSIALAGISLPFLLAAAISLFLRKDSLVNDGHHRVAYGQFLMFMGVSLSVTAFPVLARILAELKLLTTHVGQTAMAAAAFNDVAAWILLALAIALPGPHNDASMRTNHGSATASSSHVSPFVTIWVLISGGIFVIFMLFAVKPAMAWVSRQCSSSGDNGYADEAWICLTLAGVMLSGFMTDLIGIHAIFGAFVFGLTIPKDGEFAARLITRIEDFVSSLLLPLYFASSGLKTDVAKIRGVEEWGLLAVVISTACAGKILGTFVVAMMCMIPARESLMLGLLMNTKGLVELIVLNIGKEKKVLNDEMFAILVLMALFTTFMTTPTVTAIYKPSIQPSDGSTAPRQFKDKTRGFGNTKDELRVLACVHGPRNVPSLINLIELVRTTHKSLKLYVMHLVELTDRSSSIAMVHRARKNGFPFINRLRRGLPGDQVAASFEAYSQLGRARVRHSTAISSLATMHDDICHVADEKRADMIILPFQKQWRGEGEEVENVGRKWRDVNQRVLEKAPCSVAIMVDRGFGHSFINATKKVGVLFFGGEDDREALEVGNRIAKCSAAEVNLIRFVKGNHEAEWANIEEQREKDLDEAVVAEFRSLNTSAGYEEKQINDNIKQDILAMAQRREHELLITGRRQSSPSAVVGNFGDHQMENQELGTIGDILASVDSGNASSVLVIQYHDLTEKNNGITKSRVSVDKDSMVNYVSFV